MSSSSNTTKQRVSIPTAHLAIDQWFRELIRKKITALKFGKLKVTDPMGAFEVGGSSGVYPSASIVVNDLKFYRHIALGGGVGVGEAYMEGVWRADSLVDVVRLFVLNSDVLQSFESGMALLTKPVTWAYARYTRNTIQGSKKNIEAHYDLSNNLFNLFLDQRMMYSSAYFKGDEQNLDAASKAKLERICQKLDLNGDDHVVEIGTGWGGFAIFAAQTYGCRVTTTTISQEQHDFAQKKIREAGLEGKITLLLQDYRQLTGTYTKLVSIEMIEAVGAEFLQEYLNTCSKLLADDGLGLIQAITINDQVYDRALKEVDFIKKFIFPGSFIPSIHAVLDAAKSATDLRLYHLEDMTPSYVKTLTHWRERFLGNSTEIKNLGFDDQFIRLWDYYFCYCIGGFQERSIGSAHLVFGKPGYRGDISQNSTWSSDTNNQKGQ